MLKKSKTKYGYARKILALPLLFTVAFIYMVNAENREITATNQEITEMVSSLKKDTIPPTPPVPPVHDAAVPPVLPELPDTPPEIKAVEKELQLKEKDLEPMNKEIIRQYEEKGYKFNMKNFESKHAEKEELNANNDSYYNSADLHKKVKDAEVKVKDAKKIINSPEFKIKATAKSAKEAEKLMNSPEVKQKIKEAENKAKTATETAHYSASAFNKNKKLKVPNEDVRYFIDDKPSTKMEVKQFDPQRIRLMHVSKPELNGVKLVEIRIITNKKPNPKT